MQTYFVPYLKISKNCGTGKGCLPNVMYKTLNGKRDAGNYDSISDASKVRIADGASLYLRSFGGKCNHNGSYSGSRQLSNICGDIRVDVNGNVGPNRWGVDFFIFHITKYGIYPTGMKDGKTNYFKFPTYCNKNSTDDRNGYACTAWVLGKENMDYLHKDVAW